MRLGLGSGQAGSSSAARMAMIAMTTNSSMSVNPVPAGRLPAETRLGIGTNRFISSALVWLSGLTH